MGTNYIAPTWRMPENTNKDKLSNYSIDFGTTSDVISTNTTWQTDVGLNNVEKLSFSIWVKPDSGTGSSIMAVTSQAYGSWNGNFNITYRADVTTLALEFRGTGNIFINNSTTLTGDTWHHICFVIDLTLNGTIAQEVKCFVNNSEVANQSSANPPINFVLQTASFNIGRTLWGSGASGYQWNGAITQACFFDYALSTDQRNYLYNLNNPMAISGAEPVAYWPLGDNSNPTALAGYPNISVGADSVFDFNSSFIDPGSVDLGVNGSVAMWFNPEVGSVTDYVLLGEGSQGFDYVIRRQSGAFYIWIGGTFYNFAVANDIVDGSWNFLVITKSAGDVNVYLKNPSGEFSDSHTNAGWTSASFKFDRIGGRTINPINLPFNGEISNFQAWDTTLTNTEITTLYNNGQPLMTGTQPQAANLKVWYKLNQSSNWEADSTGNWQIPDARSAFPQSFNFIASQSDAINFGPANGLGFDSQISISAWFNQTPGGGNLQQLVAEDKTGSERNWGIILVGRVPNFQFFDEAGVQVQLVGTALPEGDWHHILCTATGDTSTNGVKMYINGQLAAQGTASNENIKNDNIQAKIGTQTAPTSTYYFDGKISNVAVWNTDQSSEKDNIYNSGTPATSYTNIPQYWYKLDNTSIWNPAPANYWSFPNSGELTNYGIFNFSN